MQTLWDYRYAQRIQQMSSSIIRELLKLTNDPQIISFAGGLPAPSVFPVEEFKQAAINVLNNSGSAALQYGSTEGFEPLRKWVVEYSVRTGINITTKNVMITSGSQQGLDLIGRVFINPGDRILVEAPTYLGALQAWQAYQAEFISVESDEHGMKIDALDAALRAGPKFIYVLPNFQNPTGRTTSLERRQKIVDLAQQYGVPIVEDDPYGELRFEGEALPSISSLDSECVDIACTLPYAGNVIYLSTFSKILAPGLRLAWVIAPENVISTLVKAKQGADLNTAKFTQMTAHEVCKNGFIDQHINVIRKVYLERRNTMLDCLDEHMPKGVQWNRPEGGLFLWVTLPEHLNTTDLLQRALKEKVAFVPGEPFFPSGGGQNNMRLNFSFSPPDLINEGIARLGRVIQQEM
ncbi:MAG: PLP-dependent aminotransferase family protein [Anaerolineaceae bacterium]|jgi:2-aminoadipate transaminase|nr:PLP-dependent aminotransferase family protein [Anaerolineaceae bacterium]